MARKILIVEDDGLVRRTLTRELRLYRPCVGAGTASSACDVIGSSELLSGIIVDAGLESATAGIGVLKAFRGRYSSEPAMILTGQGDDGGTVCELIRAADTLRARLVLKRDARRDFYETFGLACVRADLTAGFDDSDELVREALQEYAEEHALSEGEAEVLVAAALENKRSPFFEEQRGLSEGGYKWRVRSLLKKASVTTLDEAVRCVLLRAARKASAPPPAPSPVLGR